LKYQQQLFMHGASNRFLVHLGEGDPEKLCQQLHGADGVLLVHEDDEVDAFVRIFNADGSEAEQCGNGLRCVALHLVRSKLVEKNELAIRTLAGVSQCVVREDCNEVEVSLCIPIVESCADSSLANLFYVNMGNPNAVYWTEEDPVEVREALGEQLSSNTQFINGMNVHFARRDGEQYATCASFERGVGNTHASGTGGASVFVASGAVGPFYVSSVGGTLTYRFNEKGEVVMAGPAGYE
jgi:diaminopimelate epimerase